jgi:hypothetical protein
MENFVGNLVCIMDGDAKGKLGMCAGIATVCANCGEPFAPPIGLFGTNDCECPHCRKCYAAKPDPAGRLRVQLGPPGTASEILVDAGNVREASKAEHMLFELRNPPSDHGVHKYSVEGIKSQWDEWPDIRVRFGPRESGWAKLTPEGYGIVRNTPLEPRLCYMDVVELVDQGRTGMAQCGDVVWRAYPTKSIVLYPPADEDSRKVIIEALRRAELPYEPYTPGHIAVSHHNSDELLQSYLREVTRTARIYEVTAWNEDDDPCPDAEPSTH